MYDQFQQISKMGPLSKLMGSIPGMPTDMLAGSEEEGTKRLKRMMCIMDSMNETELDSDSTPLEEILSQYKRFQGMVKTMGGKDGLFKNMPSDPRKMKPDQIAKMQQSMSQMIPPHMLQQMGKNKNKLLSLNIRIKLTTVMTYRWYARSSKDGTRYDGRWRYAQYARYAWYGWRWWYARHGSNGENDERHVWWQNALLDKQVACVLRFIFFNFLHQCI
jgi:hypothetical protein